MGIKGVIFDLDGVLCSTDECHYLAWKELADSLGIPFDETINRRLRGVSRMESLDIILQAAGRALQQPGKTGAGGPEKRAVPQASYEADAGRFARRRPGNP